MTPRLIGFLTEVEREFFDLVCEVDGVGVKKALRAMVRPVREVAAAIEEQDLKALSALPGIGPATAERMVAKLRRRMPKFALMVAREDPRGPESEAERDVMRETFDALRSLGHSEQRRPAADRSGARRQKEIQNRGRNAASDLSAEPQKVERPTLAPGQWPGGGRAKPAMVSPEGSVTCPAHQQPPNSPRRSSPRGHACSQCGSPVDDGDKFCNVCGTPQQTAEKPAAAAATRRHPLQKLRRDDHRSRQSTECDLPVLRFELRGRGGERCVAAAAAGVCRGVCPYAAAGARKI